jgi:hypothetical protein
LVVFLVGYDGSGVVNLVGDGGGLVVIGLCHRRSPVDGLGDVVNRGRLDVVVGDLLDVSGLLDVGRLSVSVGLLGMVNLLRYISRLGSNVVHWFLVHVDLLLNIGRLLLDIGVFSNIDRLTSSVDRLAHVGGLSDGSGVVCGLLNIVVFLNVGLRLLLDIVGLV